MGKSIYISDELYDYLNKKFSEESMDSTIKKLLHLQTKDNMSTDRKSTDGTCWIESSNAIDICG